MMLGRLDLHLLGGQMTTAALAACATVGDRVDLLCRLHGIRTSDLARAVERRPQYIGRIRNNQLKRPNADLIDRIAAYFDVDDRLLRTGHARQDRSEDNGDAAPVETDASPRAEFEIFMRTVTAAARNDPQARDIVTRAIRLVLEDLARDRLSQHSPQRAS